MKNIILNLAMALTLSIITHAALANSPSPTLTSCEELITLRAGTVVSLTLNEEVNSDEIYVGNTLDFMVRSNVTVNGKVVIAAGSIAEGWVRKVKRGCNGACAEITITVENVQSVDGQRIFLRSIPHKVKADCCSKCSKWRNTATLYPGTNLSARVLNDSDIDA